MKAKIYGSSGAWEVEGASVKSIFTQLQNAFGHCLGRIMEGEIRVGWRFARCGEGKECIVEVFEVYLEEICD